MGQASGDLEAQEMGYYSPAIGHNRAPFDVIADEINDLYDTAKDFCDGAAIADQQTADAITKIMEGLHDAGKRADEMRVIEKKPHDDAAKAVQAKYKPLTDKAALGKKACQDLLSPWRAEIQRKKDAEAAEAARIAAEKLAAAQALIQATSGNLLAREEAEAALKAAKKDVRFAAKISDGPTGVRTEWDTVTADKAIALDWAYARDARRFDDLALEMAREAVRLGARALPGFAITERKVARV